MVLQLLFMALFLGASSFGVGMLPLSYTFSRSTLECLSVFGTGLLLGAALGVIIPEGIETIKSESSNVHAGRIASCLVTGFILMVIVEQLVAPSAHSHSAGTAALPMHGSQAELVVDVVELEETESSHRRGDFTSGVKDINIQSRSHPGSERAFTLLLGLVIHAAADGLALGVANLATNKDGNSNPVSFIVFLALMLHKAPTSLAFTTSLMSTNLPRPSCKIYVAVFSTSTPLSAIASYLIFRILGNENHNDVTGTALLISGGSFLYVATVLQPVSQHSPSAGDLRPVARVLLLVVGILTPLAMSTIMGHGH